MTDVVVIGGGVIGLSIAYELAGQGVAVKVIEKGDFGAEASWAGAGILPPGNPRVAKTAESRLRAESCRLWPTWSEVLREETGIDNGFRQCGGIEVQVSRAGGALQNEIECWQAEGVAVENLSPVDALKLEPELTPRLAGAYRLPELSQVRNPRHLKALLAACATCGVELIAGEPVIEFDRQSEKIIAVRTPDGVHTANQFCVAGGAWSRLLLERLGVEIELVPVRGQMVLLAALPLPFRHVIQSGARYLVPRPDGRILIGSTEEHVGFEKKNTASGVAGLIEFGVSLVPILATAKYERAWCGLRPCSVDGLPYLDRAPGIENLFIAAGHFRAGLQLSPATGVVIRQLMLGQETLLPLDAFACDRDQSQRLRTAESSSAR